MSLPTQPNHCVLFSPLIAALEFEPGAIGPWVPRVATLQEIEERSVAVSAATDRLADKINKGKTDPDILAEVGERFDTVMKGLGIAVIEFLEVWDVKLGQLRPAGAAVYTQGDADYPLGSLGKVMIMYAAFQLRKDVRDVIAGVSGIASKADLERELKKWWSTKDSRWGGFIAEAPMPKLDKIFDLSALATRRPIEFLGEKIGVTVAQTSDPIKVNRDFVDYDASDKPDAANVAWLKSKGARVDKTFYQGDLEKLIVALELLEMMDDATMEKWNLIVNLDFAERLWMTTLWSDNCCATSCISDIGLPYIQALMRASGFDNADGRMSLVGIYQAPVGADAVKRFPVSALANKDVQGQMLYRSSAPISNHSGGPIALARFLVALQEKTLVSKDASVEMKEIIRHMARFGFGSFSAAYFDELHRSPTNDQWGKLGITGVDAGKSWYNDAVVVERGSGVSTRRYGLVILGVHTADQTAADLRFLQVAKTLWMSLDKP